MSSILLSRQALFVGLLLTLPALQAVAQEAQATASAALPPASACADPCLRAGTLLELEISDPLSSMRNKRGDQYRLRLLAPVVIDGVEVLPAGTPVIGAVVHANKSRSGGQPGELLVAARSMQAGGIDVPLKGMQLGLSGKDESGNALVASFVIGPLAMFIRGREIDIPAGTRARAKVAADTSLATPQQLLPATDAVPQVPST